MSYSLTINTMNPTEETEVFFVGFEESGLLLPTMYTDFSEAQDGMVAYCENRLSEIDAVYANRVNEAGEPVTKGRRSNAHYAEMESLKTQMAEVVNVRNRDTAFEALLAARGLSLADLDTIAPVQDGVRASQVEVPENVEVTELPS